MEKELDEQKGIQHDLQKRLHDQIQNQSLPKEEISNKTNILEKSIPQRLYGEEMMTKQLAAVAHTLPSYSGDVSDEEDGVGGWTEIIVQRCYASITFGSWTNRRIILYPVINYSCSS